MSVPKESVLGLEGGSYPQSLLTAVLSLKVATCYAFWLTSTACPVTSMNPAFSILETVRGAFTVFLFFQTSQRQSPVKAIPLCRTLERLPQANFATVIRSLVRPVEL